MKGTIPNLDQVSNFFTCSTIHVEDMPLLRHVLIPQASIDTPPTILGSVLGQLKGLRLSKESCHL